ncbi:hypothetical protein JCM11251_002292 [Rhodosporidiobolus azoricus]
MPALSSTGATAHEASFPSHSPCDNERMHRQQQQTILRSSSFSSMSSTQCLPCLPPPPPSYSLPRYLPPYPSHIRPVKVEDLNLPEMVDDLRDVPDLFLRDMLVHLAPRLLAGVDSLTVLPPSASSTTGSSSFPSPLPPVLPCIFSPTAVSCTDSLALDNPPIPPTHLLALAFSPSPPSTPDAPPKPLERVLIPIHSLPWALTSGVIARALAACTYRASSPVPVEKVEEDEEVVAASPPLGSIFASPSARMAPCKPEQQQQDNPSPFAYNAPPAPPPPTGSIFSSAPSSLSHFQPSLPSDTIAAVFPSPTQSPRTEPGGAETNAPRTLSQVRSALAHAPFMRSQPNFPSFGSSSCFPASASPVSHAPPAAMVSPAPPHMTPDEQGRLAQAVFPFRPQPSFPSSLLPPTPSPSPSPTVAPPPSTQKTQRLRLDLPVVRLPLILPSRSAFIDGLYRGWVYGGDGAEGRCGLIFWARRTRRRLMFGNGSGGR